MTVKKPMVVTEIQYFWIAVYKTKSKLGKNIQKSTSKTYSLSIVDKRGHVIKKFTQIRISNVLERENDKIKKEREKIY